MTDLKKLRELAEIAARHNGYGVFTTDECQNFSDAANPQAIIEVLDMVDRYREALSTIETLSSYSNRIVHIDTARKELHKIKWLAREALEGGK